MLLFNGGCKFVLFTFVNNFTGAFWGLGLFVSGFIGLNGLLDYYFSESYLPQYYVTLCTRAMLVALLLELG